MPVLSKEFLDIQATTECRFTLKCAHDMIITYSKIPPVYDEGFNLFMVWNRMQFPLFCKGLLIFYAFFSFFFFRKELSL